MIEEVDERLQEWISGVVGGVPVSLSAPSDSATGVGVGLFLLELRHTPSGRGARRPPLQVVLRYLVTTWSADPREAHRLLGQLVFAALAREEFEVELEPVPVAMWSALGVAPRPSFLLRVPLRHERPEPRVQRVRLPIRIDGSPLASFDGCVLGPGDLPIMHARVEIPALHLSTLTDSRGRFRFPAVATDPPVTQLRVSAKGVYALVEVSGAQGTGEPMVIRLHDLEV